MAKPTHSFQQLCHEAVIACGADIPAIERYVVERIDCFDAESREGLKRDLQQILAFRSPQVRQSPLN